MDNLSLLIENLYVPISAVPIRISKQSNPLEYSMLREPSIFV